MGCSINSIKALAPADIMTCHGPASVPEVATSCTAFWNANGSVTLNSVANYLLAFKWSTPLPSLPPPSCLTPLADRDRLRKSVIKDREYREKTTIERERGRPFPAELEILMMLMVSSVCPWVFVCVCEWDDALNEDVSRTCPHARGGLPLPLVTCLSVIISDSWRWLWGTLTHTRAHTYRRGVTLKTHWQMHQSYLKLLLIFIYYIFIYYLYKNNKQNHNNNNSIIQMFRFSCLPRPCFFFCKALLWHYFSNNSNIVF